MRWSAWILSKFALALSILISREGKKKKKKKKGKKKKTKKKGVGIENSALSRCRESWLERGATPVEWLTADPSSPWMNTMLAPKRPLGECFKIYWYRTLRC